MSDYFEYHYQGPAFVLFGVGHLAALAVIGAIVAAMVWGWKPPDDRGRRRARLLLVAGFLITEGSWHAWNLANGAWNLREHLPLHSCAFSIWCTVYMLLTRSYRVYEIVFFVGIAGATQVLITPNAGIYGLPHFRALQTLTSHGLLVIALVYMTAIEGFRPSWRSVLKAMLALNVYLLLVHGINIMLGSNYLYTMHKPPTASLLDLLGPWPWYLLVCELLALALFSLLMLPFRRGRATATGSGALQSVQAPSCDTDGPRA